MPAHPDKSKRKPYLKLLTSCHPVIDRFARGKDGVEAAKVGIEVETVAAETEGVTAKIVVVVASSSNP